MSAIQLRLDIQIELDRIDRAVILGLVSEQSAQELKDAVQAMQLAAAQIVVLGMKHPLSPECRGYFDLLLVVLRQNPYAE